MVTDAEVYRRLGAAFSGTRPTRRVGDAGIDRRWLYRRAWGIAISFIFAFTPVWVGIGLMSRWGIFGAIDTWQLEVFGSNNVILLAVLSTPLIYLPLAIARPGRINGSTPMLLGMRQAFDNDFGPRIVSDPKKEVAKLRTAQRIAFGVMAVGVVVFAAATVKWVHDARSPHARLPSAGYATLIDPATPLPSAAAVTGVVADRSKEWAYDYTIRQDSHHDVYYPLRPLGQPATAPVALVELDRTNLQYDATAVYNMVDAPGPREGVPPSSAGGKPINCVAPGLCWCRG